MRGTEEGVCAAEGYCAFEVDESRCPSGLEYDALASPALAGSCVPSGADTIADADADTGITSTTNTGATTGGAGSGSSGLPDSDGGPCSPGSPCMPEDLCASAGRCEADGSCRPTDFIPCNAPPSTCFQSGGECVMGMCQYMPRSMGALCEDGDACTQDDRCDSVGTCIPGSSCPSTAPCQLASCVDGGCVYTDACAPSTACLTVSCMDEQCVSQPVADGTSCGPAAADRCCNGSCVDISSDTDHCGGCNADCAPGLMCESVAATAGCDDTPPFTSGRCRCLGSNADCPMGQLCRNVSPYPDRCAPSISPHCDGVIVQQNGCPSFCSY